MEGSEASLPMFLRRSTAAAFPRSRQAEELKSPATMSANFSLATFLSWPNSCFATSRLFVAALVRCAETAVYVNIRAFGCQEDLVVFEGLNVLTNTEAARNIQVRVMRQEGAPLCHLQLHASFLCSGGGFHALPARQFVTFLVVMKPHQHPESSIWSHIGTKSGGRISSISSRPSSIELSFAFSALVVGRSVEVAPNDVYVAQFSDFPALAQKWFCDASPRRVDQVKIGRNVRRFSVPAWPP